MKQRGKHAQVYWRDRGGARRAYADVRAYSDVGGGREALVAPGEKLATTDATVAQVLLARRIESLENARRGRAVSGLHRTVTLAEFAREHLIAKAKAGRVGEQWLAAAELHLRRAIDVLGAGRDLNTIGVADVCRLAARLQADGMSGGSARHHLNSLSNVYRRAQAEGCVPPGYNPVAGLMEKPTARRVEARWLEVPEAALLLESARSYVPKRADLAVPFAYPLVATFLLTGGRPSEVLGLEAHDVSFDRRTVTFRPNDWRRLKTESSLRSVPLWPQLEEILRAYVFGSDAPPGRLLFPSLRTGHEAMLTDCRKLLDAVAAQVGHAKRTLNLYVFRHTYCAARLQTIDRGAPVSEYTVGRELGHGGSALVRRVYGHLGQVRHRSEVVEYRIEQHAELLRGSAFTTPPVAPRARAADSEKPRERATARRASRFKYGPG